MSKVDDLTILLKAKDQTAGAFKSLDKRVAGISGLVGKLAKGFLAIGAAVATAFTAAVANGKTINDELTRMSNSIGTSTKEADELYKIIREGAPTTNLDNLGEGLLTLKEGFFDARAESGPLFDLIKDFGANIDLGVEKPREQLLEFLKAMREIPSATVRAGAAVANFGGEDAKAIIKITNDVDVLDQTIAQLSGTLGDLPSFISDSQIANMDAAKSASSQLANSWDDLSTTAYSLVAPAIEFINTKFSDFIDWTNKGIKSFGEFIGVFDSTAFNPTTFDEASVALEKTTKQLMSVIKQRDEFLATGGIFGGPAAEFRAVRLNKEIDELIEKNAKYYKLRNRFREQESKTQELLAGNEAEKAAKSYSDKMQKTFLRESARISSSGDGLLLGLSNLDLGQAIDKKLGLPALKDRQYLRIMGLDLDEGRKEELAAVLTSEFEKVLQATQAQINQKQSLLGVVKSMDSIVDGLAANDNDATLANQGSLDAQNVALSEAATNASNFQNAISAASGAVNALGNAFAANKNKSKDFVAIQQTLALVSAYSAATQALAEAKGDPVLRFAAYASVLAQGLAGYTAIKNAASSGGLSSGGSSSSTGASAQTSSTTIAQPQQETSRSQRVINITLQGNGNYTREQLEDLFDAINETDGLELRANRVAA